LRQEKFEAAKQLLRQAADSDPAYATPVAWLARSNSLMVGQGWSTDRAKACADGMQLARQAIELDPTNSLALSIAGHLSSFLQFDYKMAETLFDRAIAACHNDAFAWSLSAATLFYVGRVEEARQRAAHGLRLSPFDECIHQLYFCMGLACYGCLDYAEAQSWCRKAIAENPHYTVSYKVLTAALVGEGRISEARDVARELRRLEPNFSQYGGITPIADPIIRERYLTQLRSAGALDPVTR
jgi:tetratricopeptide (TPR) repeat protein